MAGDVFWLAMTNGGRFVLAGATCWGRPGVVSSHPELATAAQGVPERGTQRGKGCRHGTFWSGQSHCLRASTVGHPVLLLPQSRGVALGPEGVRAAPAADAEVSRRSRGGKTGRPAKSSILYLPLFPWLPSLTASSEYNGLQILLNKQFSYLGGKLYCPDCLKSPPCSLPYSSAERRGVAKSLLRP